MKLVIDIGNTAVKLALFEEKELLRTIRFEECSLSNVRNFITKQDVKRTILCSVRKFDNDIQEIIKEYKAFVVNEKTLLPVKIIYKNPENLGVDRIANVVAASIIYSAKNVLVFDFGSCLTVDFIKSSNKYIGGRISPGLKMRYKSLHYFTDKLPLCDVTLEDNYIGNDTISSIICGVQRGMVDEVSSIINTFIKENNSTVVVFTGGDCFFFEKAVKNTIFADPFLVLKGLNEILDYNE